MDLENYLEDKNQSFRNYVNGAIEVMKPIMKELLVVIDSDTLFRFISSNLTDSVIQTSANNTNPVFSILPIGEYNERSNNEVILLWSKFEIVTRECNIFAQAVVVDQQGEVISNLTEVFNADIKW